MYLHSIKLKQSVGKILSRSNYVQIVECHRVNYAQTPLLFRTLRDVVSFGLLTGERLCSGVVTPFGTSDSPECNSGRSVIVHSSLNNLKRK